MSREIIETKNFTRAITNFIKKRHLLQEDFESFKKEICENPTLGDLIIGTGGVRKVRLNHHRKAKVEVSEFVIMTYLYRSVYTYSGYIQKMSKKI